MPKSKEIFLFLFCFVVLARAELSIKDFFTACQGVTMECSMKCVYEKMGYIKPDGTVDFKLYKEKHKVQENQAAELDVCSKIPSQTCQDIKELDKCFQRGLQIMA